MKRGTLLKRGNSKLKSSSTLKRTGKMLKVKSVDLKYLLDRKAKTEKQWELFKEIFKERGPYSEISGDYLGKEPLSWMFDHLLNKSKYPHLRYEKDNILMVTFEEHELKTNGNPLPKHVEAIEKAREKFLK